MAPVAAVELVGLPVAQGARPMGWRLAEGRTPGPHLRAGRNREAGRSPAGRTRAGRIPGPVAHRHRRQGLGAVPPGRGDDEDHDAEQEAEPAHGEPQGDHRASDLAPVAHAERLTGRKGLRRHLVPPGLVGVEGGDGGRPAPIARRVPTRRVVPREHRGPIRRHHAHRGVDHRRRALEVVADLVHDVVAGAVDRDRPVRAHDPWEGERLHHAREPDDEQHDADDAADEDDGDAEQVARLPRPLGLRRRSRRRCPGGRADDRARRRERARWEVAHVPIVSDPTGPAREFCPRRVSAAVARRDRGARRVARPPPGRGRPRPDRRTRLG